MNDFSELEADLKSCAPRPLAPELVLADRTRAGAAGGDGQRRDSSRARRRARHIWWSLGLGLAGATALSCSD